MPAPLYCNIVQLILMIALIAILVTADSVLGISSSTDFTNCGLYHTPPCYFIPSPPGQTPHCARPGNTYCEHIDNYPAALINHLVHKWNYDGRYLFVDESQNDFSSLWPVQAVNSNPYSYPSEGPQSQRNIQTGYNYGGPNKYIERSYSLVSKSTRDSSNQEQLLPKYFQYTSINQKLNSARKPWTTNQSNFNFTLINQKNYTINHNKMWSTMVENLNSASHDLAVKRSTSGSGAAFYPNLNGYGNVSLRIPFADIIRNASNRQHQHQHQQQDQQQQEQQQHSKDSTRHKRQSFGRMSLCQTNTRYIAPQAALNSKGNWMYIINEETTAKQVVKTEVCSTDTCTNMCQLPNGYNSRCEQKYVQKRLIALQGNGQNLYMDTFWFPSCCICTISGN